MSVAKLLSRIVMPSDLDVVQKKSSGYNVDRREQRIGINISQPKSVAEQNSIDLSWKLPQADQFKDLCGCIYSTKSEFSRFRQLVVQAVLATDTAGKELKVLRNARWDSAFPNVHRYEDPMATVNRKATFVMEHLIQASDVAYTMQHWQVVLYEIRLPWMYICWRFFVDLIIILSLLPKRHVYRKWNENLFFECYRAFQGGRLANDPSLNWYRKASSGSLTFTLSRWQKKTEKSVVCLEFRALNV
ncbi:hypothetical protein ACA910_002525 [Epithemia clementina (nom. ined.)]